MRIIYIGGWQRSGTTLLGELIGAGPGVLFAGEVSGIWDAAARDALCSCHRPLAECPVWGASLRHVEARMDIGPDRWAELGKRSTRLVRTRNLPHLIRARLDGRRQGPEMAELLHATHELLRSALVLTGSDVLVDSSKLFPHVLFHALNPASDLAVVHIVRDPRAVAAAEARTAHVQQGNPDSLPPGASPMRSLERWYRANLTLAIGLRVAQVTHAGVGYRELVTDPLGTLTRLGNELNFPVDGTVSSADELLTRDRHVAVGNPARMQRGARQVVAAESRRDDLPTRARLTVELLAAPSRIVPGHVRW